MDDRGAAARERLEAFRVRWGEADATGDSTPLQTQLAALQRWLLDQSEDALRSLEADGYLARHFPFFADCQRRCLRAQELTESAALLGAPARDRAAPRAFDSDFGKQTYDRVAEVLALVDFSRCHSFVMIGCGPFPAAALFVHDHTSAGVTALDSDAEAVAMATRLAATFAPARVRIVEDAGHRFDYGTADVVYVANHVFPKAEVLRRIADTAPETAQVVLRDPFGWGRLFAEAGEATLDSRFTVAARGEGNRHFLSRHVLLGRRAEAR